MLKHLETSFEVRHVNTHCFHVLCPQLSILFQNMNAVPQTTPICHFTKGLGLVLTNTQHFAQLVIRLYTNDIRAIFNYFQFPSLAVNELR